jgi:hypothetical protein
MRVFSGSHREDKVALPEVVSVGVDRASGEDVGMTIIQYKTLEFKGSGGKY